MTSHKAWKEEQANANSDEDDSKDSDTNIVMMHRVWKLGKLSTQG